MNIDLAILIARSVHIVVIAGIGTFAIYLGYRLLRDMPSRATGETKLSLPGGISIYMSRVGPGIFLALFGTTLIGFAVSHPAEHQVSRLQAADGSMKTEEITRGFADAPAEQWSAAAGGTTDRRNASPAVRVKWLAEMARELPSSNDKIDKEESLYDARVCLMQSAWQPEWGNSAEFSRWVTEEAGRDPAPASIAGAAMVFEGRTK